MRVVLTLFALLFSLSSPAFAGVAPPTVEAPEQRQDRAPPTADELLERLANAESRREALAIERQLHELWSRSGSPTADLLLQRGEKALQEHDPETAQAILERLTDIAPAFAEAWYQRAAVAAQMEDFEAAILSLRQVLTLQPKHFVALAELGSILEDFGDKERALAAYRQALEINPFMDGLEERIRDLSRDVEGQGI